MSARTLQVRLRALLIFLFVCACACGVCACGVCVCTVDHCSGVFQFFPDARPCRGLEEALARYREITPSVQLSGNSSFLYFRTRVRVRPQFTDEYMALCLLVLQLAPWPRTGPTSLYASFRPQLSRTHARTKRNRSLTFCFVGERPVRRSSMRPSALCVRRAPTTFSSSLPMARWVFFFSSLS
jgi:hypothetical protein